MRLSVLPVPFGGELTHSGGSWRYR